jgi:hypothetical protein
MFDRATAQLPAYPQEIPAAYASRGCVAAKPGSARNRQMPCVPDGLGHPVRHVGAAYRRTATGTITPSSTTLIASVVITGCCSGHTWGTGTP